MERKYELLLRVAGFKSIVCWERFFYHDTYKVASSVYMDNFKMAGTDDGMKVARKALTGPDKLVLDPPTSFGPYLGCEQIAITITRKGAANRVQTIYLLVKATADTTVDPNKANDKIPLVRWYTKGFFGHCFGRQWWPRAMRRS